MDAEQYRALVECLYLCDRLMQEHGRDRDQIVGCLNGELRNAYLEANEKAAKELSRIRGRLQSMLH